jgi:amino acid permease
MGLRFFDGSYLAPAINCAKAGKFFEQLPLGMQPAFGTVSGGWKLDHMAFLVLSCLGTAFLAHFNAPTFYGDLENKTPERFNKVVAYGFGTSTLVFAAMMAFGFGTFGAATVGNVFVNYASTDALAILCRIAIVFSIIFTYPLAFVGLKNSALALLNHKAPSVASSEAKKNAVTALLLAVITGAALALKDLGFVAALTGSLMGSLIIYIFPALFRLKSLKNIEKRLSFTEKASTYGLIGFGSILGVVGVAVSVLKQFTSVLG